MIINDCELQLKVIYVQCMYTTFQIVILGHNVQRNCRPFLVLENYRSPVRREGFYGLLRVVSLVRVHVNDEYGLLIRGDGTVGFLKTFVNNQKDVLGVGESNGVSERRASGTKRQDRIRFLIL